MHAFKYQRPSSIDEAAAALQSAESTLLAGGQSLLPTMKLRLSESQTLIDLGGIASLQGIEVRDSILSIGAMTTHAEVAESADVRAKIPALAALAEGIGDPQVRNRGTIGGSIANNDPAADYPAALLGLGATVHTNNRQITADDFFTGMFSTALDENEIIERVSFPIPTRAGYAKFPNPASRYAIVGVMASTGTAGTRVAVTGAGASVFRVSVMEQALSSQFSAAALDGQQLPATGLNSDIHASADYRAHLVSVMAKRAVAAA